MRMEVGWGETRGRKSEGEVEGEGVEIVSLLAKDGAGGRREAELRWSGVGLGAAWMEGEEKRKRRRRDGGGEGGEGKGGENEEERGGRRKGRGERRKGGEERRGKTCGSGLY